MEYTGYTCTKCGHGAAFIDPPHTCPLLHSVLCNCPECMCRTAADGVRSGKYAKASFNLFNQQEIDDVVEIMTTKYPDVDFSVPKYKSVGEAG